MAQDLSIEYPDQVVFVTIRTIASRLWFVNNPKLVEKVLAFLAKYQERFGVTLYGFILMGNHYHLLARFPRGNRAAFLQAFNAVIACLTKWYVPAFKDGKLWGRRARVQVVPNPEDVLDRFLYLSLNPVGAGLCRKLAEFNGYDCHSDVFLKEGRSFSLVDWSDYRNRSRYNRKLKPKDCMKSYTLRYSRLPGMEKLATKAYYNELTARIEKRRQALIAERVKEDQGFAGKELLLKTRPGTMPRHTKTSTRESKRPLILTLCVKTREQFLKFYFSLVEAYRKASARFRRGLLNTKFPPGTYRPHLAVPCTP